MKANNLKANSLFLDEFSEFISLQTVKWFLHYY